MTKAKIRPATYLLEIAEDKFRFETIEGYLLPAGNIF